MPKGAQTRKEVADEDFALRFKTSGDPQCFAELFVRHRKKVYFACRAFFSDSDAAEDATQQAFLRAYQSMDRFLGGNFGGWLMRIARNVCIDMWRKRQSDGLTDEIEAVPQQDKALERSSALHFAVEKLRQEMGYLAPEQRRCLELKIDGYSYEETAQRLGLSIEAVKSHLQNGRRMLWLKLQGTLSQLK